MRRFAQITENRVHWIFESEEKPEFAPYIILIDITDKDNIEEGFYYNPIKQEFTDKKIIEEKEIIKEKIDLEKVEMAETIIKLNSKIEELKNLGGK